MTALSVIAPITDIRETPDDKALRGKLESQLVYGETFIVEEERGDWCYGAAAHDGYKGHVLKKHLGTLPTPTHIVIAGRSDLYAEDTIKSAKIGTYSFGSRVTVVATGKNLIQLKNGEWIATPHLCAIDQLEKDYVQTAMTFLETPYQWGGRSGFGIDCSGLVQVALARAGIKAPRDTEEQEKAIGDAFTHSPRHGDIVFFKGHVGIMIDDEKLLHADGTHMKVLIEPLWQVDERKGGVTSVRRI